VVQVETSKISNKPAGCGTSGGIIYRNPTLKKMIISNQKGFLKKSFYAIRSQMIYFVLSHLLN
jgi:hypothetical protein